MERRSQYEGQGIGTTDVIPSDPDALLDRLDILLASNAAGNTGVRNEIVRDELLRQKFKFLIRNHYKYLMCSVLAIDDIKTVR